MRCQFSPWVPGFFFRVVLLPKGLDLFLRRLVAFFFQLVFVQFCVGIFLGAAMAYIVFVCLRWPRGEVVSSPTAASLSEIRSVGLGSELSALAHSLPRVTHGWEAAYFGLL